MRRPLRTARKNVFESSTTSRTTLTSETGLEDIWEGAVQHIDEGNKNPFARSGFDNFVPVEDPVPTNSGGSFRQHIGQVVNTGSANSGAVKPDNLPSNPLSVDNTQIRQTVDALEVTKNNELVRVDVSDLDISLTGSLK